MIALFSESFDHVEILKYAGIVAGLGLTIILLNFIVNRVWGFITLNSSYLIRRDFQMKIYSISQKSLDSSNSGAFTNRMSHDISTVNEFPLRVANYIVDALSQIGFSTYLFVLNIWVGLFMIGYIAATIGIEFYRINISQKNNRIIKKINDSESSLLNESVRGIKDLRGINAISNLSQNSLSLTKEKQEYKLSRNHINTRLSAILSSIKTVLNFSLVGLCVYLIVTGQIEIATFFIVSNFKGNVTGFSRYIVSIKDYLSECCLSAQRLNEIFDDEKYPREKFGNKTLENFSGSVEFKGVEFSYTDSPVLNDVSFKIAPHTVTSFVGASGSGKSTIVSLINKFYDLEESCGEILLDEENIKDLSEESLRSNICTVSQSPYIFNMTIAENLRLAKPSASDDELIAALKQANIFDFVDALPEKLESKLGENGIKVSGGQKQRLAIARALLTDCKLIILDEATSALDNFSQKAIKDVVKQLAETRTVIMIAHRLSTVVDSDNILVLKDGRILAQGSHEQLMKTCEYYKNLYIEEDLQKN